MPNADFTNAALEIWGPQYFRARLASPGETRQGIALITREFLDETDPEEPIYAQLAGLGQPMSAALPAVMVVLRRLANESIGHPE